MIPMIAGCSPHGILLRSLQNYKDTLPKLSRPEISLEYPHWISSVFLYKGQSPHHYESDRHAGGVLSGLAPVVYFRSFVQVARIVPRNDSSQSSIFLRSRCLPRPSASSHLDNRARPMANISQASNLEGLHHEIHGMAEQMRIMNENNACLIEHLIANNPPPPASPAPSHRSHRFGDNESQNHHKGKEVRRRGRSPRRNDQVPKHQEESTTHKIRYLDAKIDAINIGASAPVTIDALIRQTEPPFTERIMRTRVSFKFNLPTQLGAYEGKTDHMDHLHSYKSLMSLHGYSDEVMCKAFSATLKGSARTWFRKFPLGTINSFGDLSKLFVANFICSRVRQKNASHLFIVHQKEIESLKDYIK
ncbi:hypothetical protein Acr_25g0005800 [Actinidia rufa]|uniref:Retrotransposon gag domain-containing protein n=1 Tax=Actinidia rufa TaxID=165716 RepID=A0A7J0GZH2_9ERIC|nr:hypothetical protein Acr_25g0005800 [Actinidia rufa]